MESLLSYAYTVPVATGLQMFPDDGSTLLWVIEGPVRNWHKKTMTKAFLYMSTLEKKEKEKTERGVGGVNTVKILIKLDRTLCESMVTIEPLAKPEKCMAEGT